jgi:hypothetical protein
VEIPLDSPLVGLVVIGKEHHANYVQAPSVHVPALWKNMDPTDGRLPHAVRAPALPVALLEPSPTEEAERRVIHDDPHRFLNYQKTRDHCMPWALHLDTMRAPYKLVYVSARGWTIYKHAWTSDKHRIRPSAGRWCYGATA